MPLFLIPFCDPDIAAGPPPGVAFSKALFPPSAARSDRPAARRMRRAQTDARRKSPRRLAVAREAWNSRGEKPPCRLV